MNDMYIIVTYVARYIQALYLFLYQRICNIFKVVHFKPVVGIANEVTLNFIATLGCHNATFQYRSKLNIRRPPMYTTLMGIYVTPVESTGE